MSQIPGFQLNRSFLPQSEDAEIFVLQCREQARIMESGSDIMLLMMTDGKEWGTYVSGQLGTVPQVSLSSLILDDQEYENPPELTVACRQSSVVVLLATPVFVDYLQSKSGWFSRTLQEMPETSAVIVLLLVERQEVDDVTKNDYVTSGWKFLEVGDTVEEVRKTLAQVLDEVEKCQKAKKGVEEEEEVKEGQVAGLKKEKIKPKRNSRGPSVELFPSEVYQHDVRVAMVFKEEIKGEVTIKMEKAGDQISAQRLNSTVFTFTVPPVAPGRYNLLVYVDSVRLQHCRPELSVRGADMAFFTSPYFLEQALGLKDLQELDLKLKENFNSSLPAAGSLDRVFKDLSSPDAQEQQKNSDTRYPTLLHYAAAHGLYEFSTALVECPGSLQALFIRNCDGRDPANLAEDCGFEDLAEFLIDYTELLGTKEICENYIDMCQQTEGEFEDDYASVLSLPPREETRAREVGDVVKELPALPDRPPVPPPRSARRAAPQRSESERQLSRPPPAQPPNSRKVSTLPPASSLDAKAFMGMDASAPFPQQPKLHRGAMGSRSQSELIEVNEKVKCGEINQNEAQMYLRAWHQRHRNDNSSSFKDRKRDLEGLRSEYMSRRDLDGHKASGGIFGFFRRRVRPSKTSPKVEISAPVAQRSEDCRIRSRANSNSGTSVHEGCDCCDWKESVQQRHEGPSIIKRDSSDSLSGDVHKRNGTRDSGASNKRREIDSGISVASEAEAGSETDEVFRRSSVSGPQRRTSAHRTSLGHQYLEQAETTNKETNKEAPPPILPGGYRPPLPRRGN